MSTKVALVTSESLRRPVGGGLRVRYQALGLLEAGFSDFVIFTPDPDPDFPVAQQVVKVVGPARLMSLETTGCALNHTHQNTGVFLKGRLWADLSGLGVVEGLGALRAHPFRPRSWAYLGLSAWAIRRLLARSEQIICAAESVARNLQQRYRPAMPVEILNNTIDPELFPASACGEPIVGVIGGFRSRWGRPAFEMAMQVARRAEAVPFRLVGGMDERQVARARTLPNVTALGQVDEAGFRQFFQTVSMALMPYPDWCGGGGSRLKLLQSAASALAVVSTPTGLEGFAEREAVCVGHTPDELARHLTGTLADEAERRRRGGQLRGFIARHHDYRAAGRQLAELYDRHLSER